MLVFIYFYIIIHRYSNKYDDVRTYLIEDQVTNCWLVSQTLANNTLREEILADRKSDVIWRNLIWRITQKLNFGGNLFWRIERNNISRSILTKEKVQQKGKCIVEID